MKITLLTFITAILLFSCSADEQVTAIDNNITNSRGGQTPPPIFSIDDYYTYTIEYNITLSEKEKNEIRERYDDSYGIFHHQQTNVENIEIWYATLNPALVEPSLGGNTDDDDDFNVTIGN